MKQNELEAMIAMLEGLHRSLLSMVEGLGNDALNFRFIYTPNTIAMLALHIADTERWLIGKYIGGQEVEHDHDSAFRQTAISNRELMSEMRDAFTNSIEILRKTDPESMEEPGVRFGGGSQLTRQQTVHQAMIHLAHHRGYIAMLKRLGGLR